MNMKSIGLNEKRKVLKDYLRIYEVANQDILDCSGFLLSCDHILEKAVFITDSRYLDTEPVLTMSVNKTEMPYVFSYRGFTSTRTHEVLPMLAMVHDPVIYIRLKFITSEPAWYIQISTDNPYLTNLQSINAAVSGILTEYEKTLELNGIYREAQYLLIDGALEAGDRDGFMALTDQLRMLEST